jgi:serine/threonine protein kinase
LGDRYQPLHRLGKKAGRQTWLATDRQTGSQVVVKLLTFNPEFEWDDLKLFEREAETLQSLEHAAIPRYLDFFEWESQPGNQSGKGFALVQSYLDARSLEQHLQAGRSFSEAEIQQIAKDLLVILSYLHDRQPPVIHRDIKPSNVLLTNRSGNHPGQVYLVDFGSVQTLAAREGGTITVVGTYGYMAPEQFGGRAVPASDLYALGATLIYLSTGQHPADLPQVDLQIQFESAANLSPEFKRWLKQLTAPSLNQRFASTAAAAQALEQPTQQVFTSAICCNRPSMSQIEVSKDDRVLEILLPQRQFSFRKAGSWASLLLFMLGLVLCAPAVVLLGWVVVSLMFLNVSGVSAIAGFLVPVLCSGVMGMLLLMPLFGEFSSRFKRLRFDKTYDATFGKQVTYAKGQFVAFAWHRLDRTLYPFADSELEWLAHELSAWAGVPITVVKPQKAGGKA